MDRVLQPSQVDLSVLESLEWDIIILDKKIDTLKKTNQRKKRPKMPDWIYRNR